MEARAVVAVAHIERRALTELVDDLAQDRRDDIGREEVALVERTEEANRSM